VGESRLALMITNNNKQTLAVEAADNAGISIVSLPDAFIVKYSSPTPVTNAGVRLLNFSGQSLQQQNIGSLQQAQVTIPAKGLASGMYIVQLQLDNQTITRKVIKQ